MLLLIDMDGPIADFEAQVSDEMRNTEWHIPALNRVGFHAAEDYERRFGAEARKAVLAFITMPGFYSRLPVVPGAAKAMQEMVDAGHDVRICTAPLLINPTCASDKLQWIEKNLGHQWLHRTIIAKDKTWIRGDVLIDDKPNIVGSLAPSWRQVIFATPFNRGNWHRLDRWDLWPTVCSR